MSEMTRMQKRKSSSGIILLLAFIVVCSFACSAPLGLALTSAKEATAKLSVTINGGLSELVQGQAMTLAGSVDTTETVIYTWYCDGVVVGTGQSYTVGGSGAAPAVGSYTIELKASSSTKSGSTTFSYAVIAAATSGSGDSSIAHGKDINETNTGVPSGQILTNVSASLTVTESWINSKNGGSRVLSNKNFLSGAKLHIDVEGFTVQYCKFNGVGGLDTDGNVGKNVQILYCEFDGNNENLADAVACGGSDLTIKRTNIHRWPRAMWVGWGNVLVEECYFHDLTCDGNGSHLENVYVAGGANQTYIRNKMISNAVYKGTASQISASLAIYNESYDSTFPNLDGIVIKDNYFESDGGFALYGGACVSKLPKTYGKNMTVTGNIFGRGEQRYCGVYGTSTAFNKSDSTNVWKDNTWGTRGAYWVSGDPEEGAAVAAPPPT
jgi:hypothetical protein